MAIDRETHDDTLDQPPAASPSTHATSPSTRSGGSSGQAGSGDASEQAAARAPADPVAPSPDEEYYRRPHEPWRARRASSLGAALVLVGLLLLAIQLFGRGFGFGNVGSLTLVDQTLPGNRIELSAAASDVEVRPWNRNEIHVEAIQRGGSRGDYTVDVARSGDIVRVTESNHSFFCFFCSRGVSYRISAPAGAQADIHTTSGDIDVGGLNGAVALNSVSGHVQARDLAGGLTLGTTSGGVELGNIAGKLDVTSISGDVQLDDGKVDGATVKTTSGDINLDGVAGPLNLSSVSGEITVQDGHDSQLKLSTTSGDIEYTGAIAHGGASEVNSISGDVGLRLPSDSGFRLNASSVSGELRSEFDLSQGQSSYRALSGIAGDGSARLTISTTSGDIAIERR